ncbi:MAG: NAD(P)H-hydrate epimerase, partial [Chloroflexota bacterium]
SIGRNGAARLVTIATGLDVLPAIRSAPTVTAAQMAEVDRVAVEEYGIALEMLMENASRQVAAAARALLEDVEGRTIVCVAGSGNNGGDAIGAARRLHGWGATVRCVLSAAPDRLHATARLQHDILRRLGVPIASADEARFDDADLIVDGLLGYSVSGAPRGDIELLIREADRSRVPILAIDLPSGIDPDTGQPLGIAIRAAATVTLALPKAGLLRTAFRSLVGELLIADIGIPPVVYERFGIDARRLFVSGDLVRVVS